MQRNYTAWGIAILLCIAALLALSSGRGIAQSEEPLPPPKPPGDAECLGCHTKDMIGSWGDDPVAAGMVVPAPEGVNLGPKGNPKFTGARFDVDADSFAKSTHGQMGITCVMCHADITTLPHPARLKAAECAACHSQEAADNAEGLHGQALTKGDSNAPTCADCHTAHAIVSSQDETSVMHKTRIVQMCVNCHGAEGFREKYPGLDKYFTDYEHSVHGAAIASGNLQSASCADCHEPHKELPMSDPRSSIAGPNLSATCGKCHKEISQEFDGSIHGQALKRGVIESASCAYCHGAHLILAKDDPNSWVYPTNVKNTCMACHQSESLAKRFGMSSGVYRDSFHGMPGAVGDTRVANCVSCHGVHDILPAKDPKSSVNPRNLVSTCEKCHPDITDGFVKGDIHGDRGRMLPPDAGTGQKVQYWVRFAYLILIPLTIGFMLFHNLIDWIKKLLHHYAKWKAAGGVLRLTSFDRTMHIALMLSFTVLVLSGFAWSFGWKIPGISGEAWETFRGTTHRVAAVVFILWGIVHVAWLVGTKRGRRYLMDMIPRYWDGLDMINLMLFNLGLRKKKPAFRRFSYIEKMEYLAMLWGTAVMVATGLILWFEEPFLKIIPLWGFKVANIIHYMEAILATLAIIVWHFYSVIINPEVSPMAMHWLSGNVPEDIYEEEHGLDTEALQGHKK